MEDVLNILLRHFKSLPRLTLQAELRKITGDQAFYLWEFIGLGWFYHPVAARPEIAAKLGVPSGAIIGYHVDAGHVFGGALADLINVEAHDPPYPDPFAP